jgi:hypothetical protein
MNFLLITSLTSPCSFKTLMVMYQRTLASFGWDSSVIESYVPCQLGRMWLAQQWLVRPGLPYWLSGEYGFIPQLVLVIKESPLLGLSQKYGLGERV